MLRRELIFLRSASGDGCNDRPLLLATPEDFYRPVCIGSKRTFASPACPPTNIDARQGCCVATSKRSATSISFRTVAAKS
jgi:hypothetical protein